MSDQVPARSNTDYSVYVRDLEQNGAVSWLNTYGTLEAARAASMIPRYEIDHIEKVTTTREIVPNGRRFIQGNASLTVLILNGQSVVAHGERVTTEEACEIVASYLPVADAQRVDP